MNKLNHFDDTGAAHMVDVGDKPVTQRIARAGGCINMMLPTLEMIAAGTHHKGDVLGVARLAGIMAAKKTADLIPLCHPIALTRIKIDFQIEPEQQRVYCEALVSCSGQTGVEMESLTAVQISLLTIYDMCKAVDRGMTINAVRLLQKSGGKTGDWLADC